MKVLHICQWDNPASGGAPKVAYHFVVELRKQGVDAQLLFVYGKKGWFGEQIGEFAHHLQLKSSKEVIQKGWRLIKFLFAFKPDVIHHHEGLIWTYLLSTGLTRKRVVHGHVAGGVRSFGWRTKVAQKVQYSYAKRLICISDHTKQSWMDVGYPEKYIDVLPNGVDLVHYQPSTFEEKVQIRNKYGIPLGKTVFGYVGRLHCIMKGTDDFLKTMALLPDDYLGIIAGKGQDEAYLKELASTLGVSNRVKFLGSLPDTADVFKMMDAFLFTSNFEHFGLVILEAVACKIPVFLFDTEGGINEIRKNLHLFSIKVRNHEQMKNMILEKMGRVEMSIIDDNLKKLSVNYSWGSIVKDLKCIYLVL